MKSCCEFWKIYRRIKRVFQNLWIYFSGLVFNARDNINTQFLSYCKPLFPHEAIVDYEMISYSNANKTYLELRNGLLLQNALWWVINTQSSEGSFRLITEQVLIFFSALTILPAMNEFISPYWNLSLCKLIIFIC